MEDKMQSPSVGKQDNWSHPLSYNIMPFKLSGKRTRKQVTSSEFHEGEALCLGIGSRTLTSFNRHQNFTNHLTS